MANQGRWRDERDDRYRDEDRGSYAGDYPRGSDRVRNDGERSDWNQGGGYGRGSGWEGGAGGYGRGRDEDGGSGGYGRGGEPSRSNVRSGGADWEGGTSYRGGYGGSSGAGYGSGDYNRDIGGGFQGERSFDWGSERPDRSAFGGRGSAADDRGRGGGYGGGYGSGGASGYGQRDAGRFGNASGLGGYQGGSWNRSDYDRDRHRGGRDEDRGFFERAADEVSSWFGDEDAERRRRQDHGGRGPKGYTRSDDRIREDISDRLTADWRVDASEITVEVASGEATLSGSVTSRDDKRRAEDLTEKVAGVKHVQNNLRVGQSGGSLGGSATGGSGTTASGSGLTGASSNPIVGTGGAGAGVSPAGGANRTSRET